MVQAMLAAVAAVLLARALQPDGRGTYGVLVTIGTIALTLGHLSVEQAQVVMWSRYGTAMPSTAVVLGPLVGLVAAAVAAVVVVGFGLRLPVPGYGLLLLALAAVPFAMTVLYLDKVLVLQGRARTVTHAKVLAGALQCGGLLVLIITGRVTMAGVVTLWALSMAVPLVLEIPLVRANPLGADPRLALRLVGCGLRYHLGLAAMFLLLRLDVLILNAMSTPAAVGLYTVAVTFIEMAGIVTDATAQVALPHQVDRDLTGSASVTVLITQATVWLASLTVGGLCLVAPVLVPLVCGRDFAASVPAVWALAPGLVALGATRAVGAHLLRLDRPRRSSAINVGAVLANVAFNLVLIPVWGIVGAGIASSLGYFCMAALQVWWFVRATGTPAHRMVAPPIALLSSRHRSHVGRHRATVQVRQP